MERIFLFISICIGLTACDNELNLIAEWQDIPVVYAVLSPKDTAHYIRVEKAFLDPETSAFTIARIPDSLYYENATVSLVRLSTGEEFVMQRVDGNAEGYPRDPGIFAEMPNYLYKLDTAGIDLKGGEEIEFRLNRGDQSDLVTATTFIANDIESNNPRPGQKLAFNYQSETFFNWKTDPTIGINDIILIINYMEEDPAQGGMMVPRTLTWPLARNIRPDQGTTLTNISVLGIQFYQFLSSELEAQPGIDRRFSTIDVIIDGGDIELAQYIDVGQSNTGITSSQEIPRYSNLSEGEGIFASKNRLILRDLELTRSTLDSLRNGAITRDLNFQ